MSVRLSVHPSCAGGVPWGVKTIATTRFSSPGNRDSNFLDQLSNTCLRENSLKMASNEIGVDKNGEKTQIFDQLL